MFKKKNLIGVIGGIILFEVLLYFLSFSLLITLILSTLVMVLLCIGIYKLTNETEVIKKQPIKQPNASAHVNKELAKVSETLGFDIQQLLWLSKGNISMFNKLIDSFHSIESNSQSNSASVEEINASINEFIENSETLNRKISEIEQNSIKSIDLLAKNKSKIKNVEQFMNELSSVISSASSNNLKLKDSSSEINKIVDYIRDISKETNLLSLNASIEAARAGEAGKGFAVVANEISNLSKETDNAIKEIEKIIETILVEIDTSNNSMNQCMHKIKKAEEISQESTVAVNTIEDIITDVGSAITVLDEVSTKEIISAKEIETATNSVSRSVEDTYSMVVELMNKVNLQQSKNNDIIKSGQKLNQVAEELQKLTAKLKEENEIIFGVNPFTRPDIIKASYIPILEEVCKSKGYKARTIILKDYEALINAMKAQVIDVGWFSPFAYVNAHTKCDLTPLVSPKVNGKEFYNGYIITHQDSGIETLNDLKTAHFGYVDTNSASGYLYANHLLKTENITPEEDFNKYSFLGSHDNVIQAILSNEIDAGATYDEAFMRMEKEGYPMHQIRIIATSEDIPKDAIAANNTLKREIIDDLTHGFLNYSRTNSAKIEGFVESNNQRYDIIRKVINTQ